MFSINLFAKTTAELQTEVIELYVATFKRAPDRAGLDYWVGNMQNGWSAETVATSMFDAPETKMKYPSHFSTSDFIDEIYKNILDRASDAGGKSYWLEELDKQRLSKQNYILAVVNAAQSKEHIDDRALILNKVAVSRKFVELGYNDPN